jgi:hypothetical protein
VRSAKAKVASESAVNPGKETWQTDPSPLDKVIFMSTCLPASISPKSSDAGETVSEHPGSSSGVRPPQEADSSRPANVGTNQ